MQAQRPNPWAAGAPPHAGNPPAWGYWRVEAGSPVRHRSDHYQLLAPSLAPSVWLPASAGSGVWHKCHIDYHGHSMPSGWCWGPGACHGSQPRKPGPKKNTKRWGVKKMSLQLQAGNSILQTPAGRVKSRMFANNLIAWLSAKTQDFHQSGRRAFLVDNSI